MAIERPKERYYDSEPEVGAKENKNDEWCLGADDKLVTYAQNYLRDKNKKVAAVLVLKTDGNVESFVPRNVKVLDHSNVKLPNVPNDVLGPVLSVIARGNSPCCYTWYDQWGCHTICWC